MEADLHVRSRSQKLEEILESASFVQQATGFRWAEGPLWLPRDQRLLFSDLSGNRMYTISDDSEPDSFRTPSNFANGNALDATGRLITCQHGTRNVTRTEHDGTIASLIDRYEGHRLNSPNDVVVRSDGMIYFTDPTDGLTSQWGIAGEQELDFQGVYRLRPDGSLIAEATDFPAPNGLAFSPDQNLLYVDDTERMHIRVFDVAPDGALSGGRIFAEMDSDLGPGWPDGFKVDVAGNVWASGPVGIWIFSHNADILGIIETPEPVTNMAWGGRDMSALYITTASEDFSRSCLYRLGPVTTGGAVMKRA